MSRNIPDSQQTLSMLSRHLLLIVLILGMPISAVAALKSGCYFQAITTDSAIRDSIWYSADNQRVPLYATKMLRSIEYGYDEGSNITFYGNRITAEGEPIPEAIAHIPEGASRLLLIFTRLAKTTEEGLNYRVFTLKDDITQFAFGSFQFINASVKTIAVDLEGNQFILNQAASKVLEVTPPEQGDLSIRIAAKDENGGWLPNYTNGWSHSSNIRTLAFIVDAPNGRIKTLRYRQTEPRE